MRIRINCLVGIMACCFCFFFSITGHASSGFEGYAIYRDGAFLGTTWHAGLMNQEHPRITENYPVIHAGRSSSTVMLDTWDNFLSNDDNTFMGYYYPKSGLPSSLSRDLIRYTAGMLIVENLQYTPFRQINYNTVQNQTWVYPENLTYCRCDGVVEYCYEFQGIRIYGNDEYWDITRMGADYKNHHSLAAITPKSQANTYMNKWTLSNKIVYVVNQKTGKVFDVCGPSSANGAVLQQWGYEGLSNQKFRIINSSSYYSFIPQNAIGSAIEIQNNSALNGTIAQIWSIPSTGYLNSQKFRFEQNSDGSYLIKTNGSNYTKVVEVGNGYMNNGAQISILHNNGSQEQHWYFVPA